MEVPKRKNRLVLLIKQTASIELLSIENLMEDMSCVVKECWGEKLSFFDDMVILS